MHIFIPIYLLYTMVFGAGYVTAKTNVGTSISQSLSGLISPAPVAPPAAVAK
jgi:hypothetical protein